METEIDEIHVELLDADSVMHSLSVIFGDLSPAICWLSSPSLLLSLTGFLDPKYQDKEKDIKYIRDSRRGEPFHPCDHPRHMRVAATTQTDLFVWPCLI